VDEEAELAGGDQVLAQRHGQRNGARLSSNSSPGKILNIKNIYYPLRITFYS
jgi:hypothetical protein